ncbi:MAG: hypothetical protein IKJ98_02985 [Bacteroidales bacterium]|nr:hypothetical protein [Bacteroidales bacterium]
MIDNKVCKTLIQAIREAKWVYITYKKQPEDAETKYWIAIQDIKFDEHEPRLKCFIYNPSINDEASLVNGDGLFLHKIQTAKIIDFSNYEVPESLLKKITENMSKYSWLDYDTDVKYLLDYYETCNYFDNDPYQKDCDMGMIAGIDVSYLMQHKKIILNKEQKEDVLKICYKQIFDNERKQYEELALSKLSIDIGKKHYIVCFYNVRFNPIESTLNIDDTLRFNKSFIHRVYEKNKLIGDCKSTLFQYTEMNVDEFIEQFQDDEEHSIAMLESNFRKGEIINTRPNIMLLERDLNIDLKPTYNEIIERAQSDKLNVPLKSLFGRITSNDKRRKEPHIIIADEKINVDQTRVLYNAMKQPVTFVQGPPGTGKTQTILNVVLNGFYNNKTILVCSANNKPVNGIIEKLSIDYKGEKIRFPFLRLGNIEQVKLAVLELRKLFEFQTENSPDETKMNKIKETTDEKNERLQQILKSQEYHLQLEEDLKCAQKLLKKNNGEKNQFSDNIRKTIDVLSNEIWKNPEVNNRELWKLFTPLSEDYYLKQLLYYSSIKYIKTLQTPSYQDLKNICYLEDENERVAEFNKWLSIDENMKRFVKVFPIIFTTNISAQRLGSPQYMFDLVIMDEAGQCNVAHSLIPITKANSLLMVGDTLQLKPIVVLEDSINETLRKKFSIPKDYDYKHHSVLEIMREHDTISPKITLRYHYRCAKKIIDFSNQKYYKCLKLSEVEKKIGDLISIPVKNTNTLDKNSAIDEGLAIINYLKRNNIHEATIITPFVNQKELINSLLKQNKLSDVECCTVHAMQGGEKSTIILSTALSQRTSQRTFDWLKNNTELINVAMTRAKNKFVIAYDEDILKIRSGNKSSDILDLVNYVKSNGKISIPMNESVKIEIGKSNGSIYENEFYTTISHFCSVHTSFEVKRNVAYSKIFSDDDDLCKQKSEFDCVLYEKKLGKLIPKIVIEINGGEHFGDRNREIADTKKRQLCHERGLQFLMISNTFVKSYEQLRKIIINSKKIVDTQKSFNFDDLEDNEVKQEEKPAPQTIQRIKIRKQDGYCIRCGKDISYNPQIPYCKKCYYTWNKYGGYEYYSENYCHQCGKSSYGICFDRPECKSCYYN